MGKVGADKQFEDMVNGEEDQKMSFLPTTPLLPTTDTEDGFFSHYDANEIFPTDCFTEQHMNVSINYLYLIFPH